MTPVYPWRWLSEAIAPAFTVRYPWIDEVRRAGESAEAVCVVIPEAVGSLTAWGVWMEGMLESSRPVVAPGKDFPAVAAALEQLNGVEPIRAFQIPVWLTTFLPAARRNVPHVEPVPLLIVDPDDACVGGLGELVRAQRAINYPLVRPILVTRAVPIGWTGETVRFSLPEPVGDLHRIIPHPSRDVDFWTSAVLALTAIWEAGAVPALADELWTQLTGARITTLRDVGFDDWLSRRLDAFAREVSWPDGLSVPNGLAFAPARPDAVHEALWHDGAVGYVDGWFDLTPIRARTWILSLSDSSSREGVTRRRLVNAPLARWLAAWASSVEEALRVLALRIGCAQFRAYLERLPPRRRGASFSSRWEELAPQPLDSIVGIADFGDLARFATEHSGRGNGRRPSEILERCRQARNMVIHRRTATARDLLDIASAVEWLATEGLI